MGGGGGDGWWCGGGGEKKTKQTEKDTLQVYIHIKLENILH